MRNHKVPGSAVALGRCRVRLAPDLSEKFHRPAAAIFRISPRGRVLVHPRRVRSPGPGAVAPRRSYRMLDPPPGGRVAEAAAVRFSTPSLMKARLRKVFTVF